MVDFLMLTSLTINQKEEQLDLVNRDLVNHFIKSDQMVQVANVLDIFLMELEGMDI
jgi:hypothetical protein